MKVYRIKDWDKCYENNRTRELKAMQWVPIPNKLDGDGYTLLMEKKNGTAIFGAWIACVEVASKCDPRGTLLRTGEKPHDIDSLSRISRVPKELIKQMLEVCVNECKWIEYIDLRTGAEIPHEDATLSHDPALNGREWKGKKEEKNIYMQFVFLTDKEYSTLQTELGENLLKKCIETLNNYKGANGKKYKSDYLAMRNWVIDKVKKDYGDIGTVDRVNAIMKKYGKD